MFKRLLVLAVAVVLAISSFLIGSFLHDKKIEDAFKAKREKYHVQNIRLTSNETPPPVPAPSPSSLPSIPPLPETETAPTPAPTPVVTPDAAPATAPDTNMIIGPLPPSTTPATPSSTMVLPPLQRLPFYIIGAYSSAGVRVQTGQAESTNMAPGTSPMSASPSVSAMVTNNPATNAPAATETATHAASGEPMRPVPVQASVIVLGYHQFSGPGQSSSNIYNMNQSVFEDEMKYLHDNNYHVIPLSDVVRFIHHEIGLPPNSVAITIDDGYKSSINWAAPVLKRYGYPWTFFVYPSFITVAEGKGAASWNDLLQLQADGVDIESHSMTHPILTSHRQKGHTLDANEYDKFLTEETAGAKALLEQHLGKKIEYFAYPYGAYNKAVEAKAIAAGYTAIFTVADNPVHDSTNVYCIGRYIITKPVERAFASYLRQGALSVADATPAPGSVISEPRPVITAVLGYVGNLDPKSIETEVRDYGVVKHDFDPKTQTVRLYLPRDLIDPVVNVNIRARDAETGQVMVANWHFNYESAAAAAIHAPLGTNAPAAHEPMSANNNASATTTYNAAVVPEPKTNASTAIPKK